MRARRAVLDKVFLVALAVSSVACMLVGAHTLFGWPGPVLFILVGVWYGWWETRHA